MADTTRGDDIHGTVGPASGGESDAAASSRDRPRFQIIRPHDEGGLGKVSVALDTELDREVALKEIKPQYADDASSRSRFLLEAEITGGLEHPGIVPIYGLGSSADGRPYYAMRFIRGDNLATAIKEFHEGKGASEQSERTVQLRRLLGRFLDVCNAVYYAHQRGVLHRDLKPGNVMLGEYGETLVVDWGLAKPIGASEESTADLAESPTIASPLVPRSGSVVDATQLGSAIGSPHYMSPEQARGEHDKLGPAADVYSLGATLFTLLTNRKPVEGQTLEEILTAVQKGPSKTARQWNPEIDAALSKICAKAMALSAENRYKTVRALAEDIERYLADEPVQAYPEPLGRRTRRWMRKHPRLVGSAAATLVAGVVSAATIAGVVSSSNAKLGEKNVELAAARDSAVQKQQLAKAAEEKATLARDRAQRTAYNSTVYQASQLTRTDPGQALALLEDAERCPPELRGFAWKALHHSLRRDSLTIVSDSADGRAVAISPDNRFVAASGETDRTIRVWKTVNGREIAALLDHRGKLRLLKFSPSGTQLAAVSEHLSVHNDEKGAPHVKMALEIRVWELASQEVLWSREIDDLGKRREIADRLEYVERVWYYDYVIEQVDENRFVKTPSPQRTYQWHRLRLQTGTDEQQFIDVRNPIAKIPSILSHETIAHTRRDEKYRMLMHRWKWGKLEPDKTLHVPNSGLRGETNLFPLSAETTLIHSRIGEHKQLLNFWNWKAERSMRRVALDDPRIYEAVDSELDKAFLLLKRGTKDIVVFSLAKWIGVGVLRGHSGEIRAVDLSQDGMIIATLSADRKLRLWSTFAAYPQSYSSAKSSVDGAIVELAVSPDDQKVAAISVDNNQEATLTVWDTKSRKKLTESQLEYDHHDELGVLHSLGYVAPKFLQAGYVSLADNITMAWLPDNQHIAISDLRFSLAVYDSESGERKLTWTIAEQKPNDSARINQIALANGQGFFGVKHGSKRITFWDLNSGEQLPRSPIPLKSPADFAFSPSGDAVHIRNVGLLELEQETTVGISIWDLKKAAPRLVKTLDGATRAFGSADNRYFVTQQLNQGHRFWKLPEWKVMHDERMQPFIPVWLINRSDLALCQDSEVARHLLIDLITGQPRAEIEFFEDVHESAIVTTKNGKTLIVANANGEISFLGTEGLSMPPWNWRSQSPEMIENSGIPPEVASPQPWAPNSESGKAEQQQEEAASTEAEEDADFLEFLD